MQNAETRLHPLSLVGVGDDRSGADQLPLPIQGDISGMLPMNLKFRQILIIQKGVIHLLPMLPAIRLEVLQLLRT
ncbi:hypothetical protein D3C76_1757470 [compost metagenome]